MPEAPRKPCNRPGCRNLTVGRFCSEHEVQAQAASRERDKQRGSAHSRGYTSRWARYSKHYRTNNSLCVKCLAGGKLKRSECVDHIIPVVDGEKDPLFWEPKNHQALCNSCHSEKTAKEDSGFGNERRK